VTLSHLDAAGRAAMVDVGHKPLTDRLAVAAGMLRMASETLALIQAGDLPKGDVIAVARIAGIQAAKQTANLIPLCHPLPLSSVAVDIEADPGLPGLRVTATARSQGQTGVEMEALTAVAVALLTLYDMTKAVDRGMVIESVALIEKRGGVRGDWQREPAP
jgi:cyclic pyranopterin phosphate synthase